MDEIIKSNKASYWLMEIADEVGSIARSSIGEKYKIMLLMTYIDIFSNIWNIHNQEVYKKQKKIFMTWLDKFMFNDLNNKYKNEKYNIHPLHSELFYKIRNSLIHFSSLPNSNNKAIFITSNSKSEFCNKNSDRTAGKEKNIIVLSMKILSSCFIDAAILTIEEMASQDKECRTTMEKISDRLEEESAFLVKES